MAKRVNKGPVVLHMGFARCLRYPGRSAEGAESKDLMPHNLGVLFGAEVVVDG